MLVAARWRLHEGKIRRELWLLLLRLYVGKVRVAGHATVLGRLLVLGLYELATLLLTHLLLHEQSMLLVESRWWYALGGATCR